MTKAKKKSTSVGKVIDRYDVINQIAFHTHPHFNGKKFVKGMALHEACGEVGISARTFYNWIDEDESLRKLWAKIKSTQRDMMVAKAMKNVEDALYGDIKLRPAEMVGISLRFLEKVSEDFKDKTKVELEVSGDFNTPIEELKRRALEIATKLSLDTKKEQDEYESYDDDTILSPLAITDGGETEERGTLGA